MSDERVLPFERRRKAPPPHSGESPARQIARQQAASARAALARTEGRREDDRALTSGSVVPARITMALDIGSHYGPEVDLACGTREGNPAGDVDQWEAGTAVPSADQVRKLALLTGYAPRWFYEPVAPGDLTGPAWMCGSGGCELVQPSVVDERGVLHHPSVMDGLCPTCGRRG